MASKRVNAAKTPQTGEPPVHNYSFRYRIRLNGTAAHDSNSETDNNETTGAVHRIRSNGGRGGNRGGLNAGNTETTESHSEIENEGENITIHDQSGHAVANENVNEPVTTTRQNLQDLDISNQEHFTF